MSKRSEFQRGPAGFTLIEIVVIVAILAVLAGLVAPLARNLILDAKAQKIVDLCETLKGACNRFAIDTGLSGVDMNSFKEYSAIGGLLTGPEFHRLSMDSGVPGWNGPYIDRPLTVADGPTGNVIWLEWYIPGTAGPPDGFDLKGDGNFLTGPGNSVMFVAVDLDLAKAVDQKLDAGLDPAAWQTKGRVYYDPVDRMLVIFLLKGD